MNYDRNINEEFNEFKEKLEKLIKELSQQAHPGRVWLTKDEVMKMLDCSERTLQTLRDNGSLPYSNPMGGSKFFYRRKDVEQLFEKNFNGKIV